MTTVSPRDGAPASLDEDWSGLVVFCAATPWDGHRLPDQEVVASLLRFAPVLYVDPPISPMTASRHPAWADALAAPPLRLEQPGLARLTPRVLPAKERVGMKAVTDALTRSAMAAALDALGRPHVDAAIVTSFNRLFGVGGERQRVFYAEDDYVAGAELMGIGRARLRRAEARQLRDADVVVAASAVLGERLAARGAREVVVMPNGCDPALAARVDAAVPAADVTLPAPIVGLVGTLNDRLDPDLLGAVAASGISLLLVGPRAPTYPPERLSALLARPNVQWVGPRPPSALPSYLRAIDVGVVPYRDDAFNRASFPLKTLEYLTSGVPVVASDLPAVRYIGSDMVRIAADPAGFAAAVRQALDLVAGRRLDDRCRAVAEGHGWDDRVDRLAERLGLHTGAAHTGPGPARRAAR